MDMRKMLGATLLAAGIAGAPVAANAVTVVESIVNNVEDGGTYDIANGPYSADFFFYENAAEVPAAAVNAGLTSVDDGKLTFRFENKLGTDTVLAVSIGTVLQSLGSFVGGMMISFGTDSIMVSPGVTTEFTLTTEIAANDFVDLTFMYGAIDGKLDNNPDTNIDFTVEAVSAVPLPAGMLLLLSGLGGLAVFRRRGMTA